MRRDDAPWYRRFFGTAYLDVYGRHLAPEVAEREVRFVERALGLQPGDRVLDLCCGPGRHAVLLAERGLRVTALDLSQPYLDAAAAEATRRGVAIETVCTDMRAPGFDGRFDAVINMFSSFGYLESPAEDAKVLRGVATALRPAGSALFDLINREWVVRNQVADESHPATGGTMHHEHRELDLVTSRNHVTFVALAPDGSRRELGGHHIRLYTLTEIIGMLESAGLAFARAYGGFDGEPYAVDTRRMIVVATKR
jgi:SAM-dependent methyltransferase